MNLTIKSDHQTQLIDITQRIREAVHNAGINNGLCFIFTPHTTAAVTINENADPSVKEDILLILNKIIPWQDNYQHLEGNSPAHVKASLVGASEMIAVENGELVLGVWQGIFFCEFDGPRTRHVRVSFLLNQLTT